MPSIKILIFNFPNCQFVRSITKVRFVFKGHKANRNRETECGLNSKKANKKLNWQNKLTLNQSVENICEWYINFKNSKNILQKSESQIEKYLFNI